MEIKRLNQEAALKDQKLAAMEAMLAANGLLEQNQTKSHAQTQVRTQVQTKAQVHSNSQPIQGTSETISRKRRSSQQLGRAAKDSRKVATHNKFEVLKNAGSYPDRSMKPASVISTPGVIKLPMQSYASKVGNVSTTARRSHERLITEALPVREAEGIFSISNEGGLREELEVEFNKMNGEKFHGTITHNEAKHCIYKECLGLEFTNFDGARIGYKGAPCVTFKFKTAIDVDKLYEKQHFEFLRKSSRQGRTHVDVIECKIRGLKDPNQVKTVRHTAPPNTNQDDGTRKVLVQGCEYRIPKEVLVEFLSFYGVLVEDLTEELFDDGGSPDNELAGTNRTGNYIARIKLRCDIPEWVPIRGKRIKIIYPGIRRLCTGCFGQHPKKACQSKKVTWAEYVASFKMKNPGLNPALIEIAKKTQSGVNNTQLNISQAESEGDSDISMMLAMDEPAELNTNEWVNTIESEDEMESADRAQEGAPPPAGPNKIRLV